MASKPVLGRCALFLWVAPVVLFSAVLLGPSMTAAQAIDPNIQSRVDFFSDRPSGTDLVVKRPVAGEKKTKARKNKKARPRVKTERSN
jgi:hypothetical protein